MNDDDTGEVLRKAMPDAPPQTHMDLDRIVADGYRVRRRNRTAIGATTAAGVSVLAAVTALAFALDAPEGQGTQAAEGFEVDEDLVMSAHSEADWYSSEAASLEAEELTEAAKAEFGDLLVEAGYLEAADLDYSRPSADEIQQEMERHDLTYGEALSELGYDNLPLLFDSRETQAGNGGEVYLRSHAASSAEEEDDMSPGFSFQAMAPGGWAPEPGPEDEFAFPQPMIVGDEEGVTSEELDDGRLLMVAEDDCMLHLAVAYPNGSGLQSSWDTGCDGQAYDVALEDLEAAMLSMPEIEYDTSDLVPHEASSGDQLSFEEWSEAAYPDAVATSEEVDQVLTERYPGAALMSVGTSGMEPGEGSAAVFQYTMDGSLPFEAYPDGGDVAVNITYSLPGGWEQWTPETGEDSGRVLPDCDGKVGTECERIEVGGRTAVVNSNPDAGIYDVTVFGEDGWAMQLFLTFDTAVGFELTLDEFTELAAAMPAPVYDEGASSDD